MRTTAVAPFIPLLDVSEEGSKVALGFFLRFILLLLLVY